MNYINLILQCFVDTIRGRRSSIDCCSVPILQRFVRPGFSGYVGFGPILEQVPEESIRAESEPDDLQDSVRIEPMSDSEED